MSGFRQFLLLLTESGVLKLLLNLKIHKAAGPDETSSKILKELAPTIAPILTVVYKKSYQTGQLPETGRQHTSLLFSKKGKGRRHPITDLYH